MKITCHTENNTEKNVSLGPNYIQLISREIENGNKQSHLFASQLVCKKSCLDKSIPPHIHDFIQLCRAVARGIVFEGRWDRQRAINKLWRYWIVPA
mmetsp:Transcript_16411/g.39268  ORF Transcript_16411/g.39268 Transcript_16411/m.39268 type:complete len:96 (-) Transcript_16411:122-409(-)